jgi:hypothetical protein
MPSGTWRFRPSGCACHRHLSWYVADSFWSYGTMLVHRRRHGGCLVVMGTGHTSFCSQRPATDLYSYDGFPHCDVDLDLCGPSGHGGGSLSLCRRGGGIHDPYLFCHCVVFHRRDDLVPLLGFSIPASFPPWWLISTAIVFVLYCLRRHV